MIKHYIPLSKLAIKSSLINRIYKRSENNFKYVTSTQWLQKTLPERDMFTYFLHNQINVNTKYSNFVIHYIKSLLSEKSRFRRGEKNDFLKSHCSIHNILL